MPADNELVNAVDESPESWGDQPIAESPESWGDKPVVENPSDWGDKPVLETPRSGMGDLKMAEQRMESETPPIPESLQVKLPGVPLTPPLPSTGVQGQLNQFKSDIDPARAEAAKLKFERDQKDAADIIRGRYQNAIKLAEHYDRPDLADQAKDEFSEGMKSIGIMPIDTRVSERAHIVNPVSAQEMQELTGLPKPVAAAAAGVQQFSSGFLDMLKDPMMLSLGGGPKVAGAIGNAFGLQMLAHAPKEAKAAYDAYKSGKPDEAIAHVLTGGVGLYLGGKMAGIEPAEVPPAVKLAYELKRTELQGPTKFESAQSIEVIRSAREMGLNRSADAVEQLTKGEPKVTELDPIVSAAYKKDGNIYDARDEGGVTHMEANMAAENAGVKVSERDSGFVTKSGKFLNREEALKHAESTDQIENIEETPEPGKLHTGQMFEGLGVKSKKGEPNARTEPVTTSLPEHEVRAPVGEGPPLRQQGEVAEVQAPTEVRPQEEVATTLTEASEVANRPVADIETDLAKARQESEQLQSIKPPEPTAPMEEKLNYLNTTAKAKVVAAVKVQALEEGLQLAKEKSTTAPETPSTPSTTVDSLKSIDAIPEGAERQSAIDSLIAKLESARVKGVGLQGSMFPLLDEGTARALWNTGIDVMIGVLKATRSVSKAIDAAMTHWKSRHPDFDEASARKALESGLTPTEFGEQGSPAYGIAQRVREERVAEGQTAEVPPGKGISPQESVEHGRELLAAGRSPEETLNAFEKSKTLSSEDMAVVRAHGEQLAKDAEIAKKTFGRSSPEYQAAWDKLSEWDRRSKAMQTEWHKIGMAQQGETDIETGTFTGLQRAYKEGTGKDFTPKQAETAEKISNKVSKADGDVAAASENLHTHLKKREVETDAEKHALDTASKVSREWIIRKAEKETEERVRQQKLKTELEQLQHREKKAATDIINKAARERAIRQARKERNDLIKRAAEEKKKAEAERKEGQKRADAANLRIRKAAIERVRKENAEREARADESTYAWNKAKSYIDSGMEDFNDIRHKIATDMGVSVERVTQLLAKDKRAKFLQDDLWKKQQHARLLKQQAKSWVKNQATPRYLRALASVPKILFGLKVGFHGTVALGTHAPMVAFQPPFWKTYIRDFGKMYKMVGSKTYYEMQVQDLIRRPNYIEARRAGLVNDPFTYEDFNSPDTAKYFGNLTGMGNRGYTVLKILRQDMFDQHWNSLPKTARVKEVAQAIADGVNHATGVVKGKAPAVANLALFAPRLEASRVAWLAVDPAKALSSVVNWKNATEGEKVFALHQFKEKAWVAGTLFGMLALNQGILSAIDSKQKVNFFDPMRSDFLKFKIAGMDFSYGNAMISMARLPVRLYQIRQSDGGKLKNLVHPDESSYTVLGEYARSQASPFASLAESLWFKSDWQNRPLPNSNRPVPKRLRAQGVKPYTWPEFWSEQVLPIPFEEAAREVWGGGMGMSEEQIAHMRKAMATIAIMAATGGRLVEDRNMDK